MSGATESEKHRIRGEEARGLLVDAVLTLAETHPFQELTARRIAGHANVDPNAIFRQFGSVEDLLIAAVRHLEAQAIDHLEHDVDAGFTLIRSADLYLRLTSWLILSGVAPTRLATDVRFIDAAQRLTLERIGVDPTLNPRMQRAMFTIALSFIQAQALLTPTQPEVFTAAVLEDAAVLMAKFVEQVPGIADDLGWNER